MSLIDCKLLLGCWYYCQHCSCEVVDRTVMSHLRARSILNILMITSQWAFECCTHKIEARLFWEAF